MTLGEKARGRILSAAATAVVGLLALTSCGNGNQPNGGNTTLAGDQTLKFPIYSDFATLDPGQLDAETDFEVAQNLFDNLVVFDNNLKLVPDLATDVPTASSDGLSYTFHLRNDVTFSNGDKFTSADVLYSWNRAAALQGPYAANLSPVVGYDKVAKNTTAGAQLEALLDKNDPSVTLDGLTAPDPYTVQVKLSHPAGWWLSAIGLQASTGAIVDKNAVKQDPENWWANPQTAVGTGPFKMVARTPKQSVDFDAVSNWWGSQKPTLKHVHLDILQDASSGVTAWEQKKYDIDGYGGFSNIPVADVLRIQGTANEKNQLILHPKVRTTWVSFNVGYPSTGGPFLLSGGDMSKNLRTAFALAVDKQKLVSVVCHNVVCTAATGGLITKGLKGYLGDGQDPLAKFDATKAKQLLQQADPDGSKTKNLTYVYDPENPLNGSTAQFLQDQWSTNLGVHVNLQAVSHPQFIPARLKGKYLLSRDGWQADYDHPQDWFDNLWGKLASAGTSNSSGYDTANYDSTLASADSKSLTDALPLYEQLGKMLEDDVVYIPLYYSQGAFLIHQWVGGAGTNNFFDYHWDQIKIYQH